MRRGARLAERRVADDEVAERVDRVVFEHVVRVDDITDRLGHLEAVAAEDEAVGGDGGGEHRPVALGDV